MQININSVFQKIFWHINKCRYLFLTLSFILFCISCSPYGNSFNKAMVKPLERQQRRIERTAHRNYDYLPYIIYGNVIFEDENGWSNNMWVHIKGTSTYSRVDMENKFKLEFPDSLFVKRRIELEIGSSIGKQPSVIIRKKQFKGNVDSVNIKIQVPVIMLD